MSRPGGPAWAGRLSGPAWAAPPARPGLGGPTCAARSKYKCRAEPGQGTAGRQIPETYVQPLAPNFDLARGDGQAKAARARTARIHKQRTAARRDERPVRMAANDQARACGCRLFGELGLVVNDVDAYTVLSQCTALGDARGPRLGVVVAADRIERSEGAQLS